MKYEILNGSERGYLTDNTPIFADMFDTWEVSFFIEKDGNYIATFKGADGERRKSTIQNGVSRIPKAILRKCIGQFIEVSVVELDSDDKVKKVWACDPLRISSFFAASRSQLQISSGVSDEDYLRRVLDLIEENKLLNTKLDEVESKVVEYENKVSALTECIKKVVEKHNELVKEFTKMKEEM